MLLSTYVAVTLSILKHTVEHKPTSDIERNVIFVLVEEAFLEYQQKA